MAKTYSFSAYFIFLTILLNEVFSFGDSLFSALLTVSLPLFLITALALTRGFLLYISVVSFLLGHAILFAYDLEMTVWLEGLTRALGILILFVAIPCIAFPIRHGGYLESLESFVLSQRSRPSFLLIILAIIHLSLSVALNIGSIPTLQRLIDHIPFPKRFLTQIYTTGYSAYMVFSPYDAVVNMVFLFSGITYSDFLFSGVCMMLFMMFGSSLLLKSDRRLRNEIQQSLPPLIKTASSKKIFELLFHVAALIFLAFLSDRFMPLSNPMYNIAILIIFYSMFWAWTVGAITLYWKDLTEHPSLFFNYRGLLPFLIAASFLGTLISYTPLKTIIGDLLISMNGLPQYFIIQIFLLLTWALSNFGIHMMITITILAATVSPELIQLTPTGFALTLLTCWVIGMVGSPFVPFSAVVSETIKEKPHIVAWYHNLKVSICLLLFAPLMIFLVNAWKIF